MAGTTISSGNSGATFGGRHEFGANSKRNHLQGIVIATTVAATICLHTLGLGRESSFSYGWDGSFVANVATAAANEDACKHSLLCAVGCKAGAALPKRLQRQPCNCIREAPPVALTAGYAGGR